MSKARIPTNALFVTNLAVLFHAWARPSGTNMFETRHSDRVCVDWIWIRWSSSIAENEEENREMWIW